MLSLLWSESSAPGIVLVFVVSSCSGYMRLRAFLSAVFLACYEQELGGWGICCTGFKFLDRRCRKAFGVVLLTSTLETAGGGLFRPFFFWKALKPVSGRLHILFFSLRALCNLRISFSFILAGRPALWGTMACCFYYHQGNGIGGWLAVACWGWTDGGWLCCLRHI